MVRRYSLRIAAFTLACTAACQPTSQHVQSAESSLAPAANEPKPDVGCGPLIYHRHLLLVPASINGADAGLALLDTGATACALDQRQAERLGVAMSATVEVHGTAGTTQARSARLGSLAVFGRAVADVETTVYPLALLPGPGGEPVNLIIGYPFLKHFAVDIDYENKRLALRAGALKTDRSTSFRLDDGIPCIRGELPGGVAAEFRIDTGASLFDTPDAYLNITSSMLEALQQHGFSDLPEARFSGSGVGGAVELPVYRLAAVTLGSLVLERPLAIVQPRQGIFANDETPGFIANYTLDRWKRVVIDYCDETLDLPDSRVTTRLQAP